MGLRLRSFCFAITFIGSTVLVDADDYVHFQEDRGGGGTTCIERDIGLWNKGDGCLDKVGNDEIAHVKVCGDRCVEQWDDDTWSGKYYGLICNRDSECTSMDNGNGKVSSFKITKYSSHSDDYVIFYEDDQGDGGTYCIEGETGKWDRGHGCMDTLGNDEISRVKVCGLRSVTLYDAPGCKGHGDEVKNLDGGCTEEVIGNGKVSCFKIDYTEQKSSENEVTILEGDWSVIGSGNGKSSMTIVERMDWSESHTTSSSHTHSIHFSTTVEVKAKNEFAEASVSVTLGYGWAYTMVETFSQTLTIAEETRFSFECPEELWDNNWRMWQFVIHSTTATGHRGPAAKTRNVYCTPHGWEPQCPPSECDGTFCQSCINDPGSNSGQVEVPFDITSFEVCASEKRGVCNCDRGYVYYGYGNTWVTKGRKGDQQCTNSRMGDPLHGTAKYCMCGSVDIPQDTFCAYEGETCNCDDGYVKYGHKDCSHWNQKGTKGDQHCTNSNFGDPCYLRFKECRCSKKPSLFKCANEGGVCRCSGGKIWYGIRSSWVTKRVSGTVRCDNSVFGDPYRGVEKECLCLK